MIKGSKLQLKCKKNDDLKIYDSKGYWYLKTVNKDKEVREDKRNQRKCDSRECLLNWQRLACIV